MNSILTRSLLVATVACGLLAPVAAAADEPTTRHPHHQRMRRALAREMDLSAEQRQALKEVLQMHQPMLRPLREQARAERAALRDLIAAPTLDEAALAAQADRIAATHKQIVVASARLRSDLRKILTAEQLARLEGWRVHARARGEAAGTRWRELMVEP